MTVWRGRGSGSKKRCDRGVRRAISIVQENARQSVAGRRESLGFKVFFQGGFLLRSQETAVFDVIRIIDCAWLSRTLGNDNR